MSSSGGGCRIYSAYGFSGAPALLTNTVQALKAFQANIFGIRTAKNTNSNDCYILLYNVPNAVVGTTVPYAIIPVPAGGYWEEKYVMNAGITFQLGLYVACVMTTPTGNTAPTTPFGVDIMFQ